MQWKTPIKRRMSAWEEIEEQYELQRREGEGGYGEVFKAIDKSTKKTVAIKVVRSLFKEMSTTRTALAELQVLRRLSSVKANVFTPKLLTVHEYFDEGLLFLVMEHVPSDLKKVLCSAREISFTEEHVIIILYNLLCAMNFFHSTNLMHRDLKPANILVDDLC